ncbi:MAG: Rieske (2Fe-2S) protein [Actinomycetota bacterium]|nr:Rieske (2Fe-2S) protein [Actinomycetota bacterium]
MSEQSATDYTQVEGTPPDQDELTSVFVGQNRIAIANTGGSYYAFDDTCTHMGCSLSDGDVDADDVTVTCPCHMGQYDMRTGEVVGGPPPAGVKTYPVQVEDGTIRIKA